MSVKASIAKLPTLAEQNAVPHATPKHLLSTRLDRALAKKAAALADERQLQAWARAVKDRDGWRDRRTGGRVVATYRLEALRAEAHHIAGRADKAVRYDVRNGICLSFATHDAVERNALRIVGTAFFEVDGQQYIDATYPVDFMPVGDHSSSEKETIE